MNRTQRRAQMRAQKRSRVNTESKQIDLTIKHGWTPEKVVVLFPQPLTNMQFTIEQAEGFIAAMRGSIEGLKALQAKAKEAVVLASQGGGGAANG